MSILTMRLLRVVVLLALLGGSLAAGSGRVAAQDLADDEYTDQDNGWSVQFDDTVWEAELIEAAGVTGVSLTGDLGYINLRVYDDGITDAGDCLADLDRFYTTGSETWEDVEPARRLDAPETARDAEAELYTGTFVGSTQEFEAVLYLECRELDDATLAIDAGTAETTYEDLVPALEEVLAAVETGGRSSTQDDDTPEAEDDTPEADDDTPEADDDTPEADDDTPERDGGREPDPDAGEIDDTTFTDTALGYSVSWDDRVWEAELLSNSSTAGLLLRADFASMVIDAFNAYEGVAAAECVESLAEGFEDFEGYSSLREAPRVEGPEPPRDGAGTVYSFTFTNDDAEEFDSVAYIECRPIDDQTMIRVSIQSTEALLEDNVDAFQEVLDSIEVEAAPEETPEPDDEETPDPDDEETPDPDDEETPDPDDEETPEPDDNGGATENDVEAGEIDDNTFTDTALGYSVSWDDRLWTAEPLESDVTAGVVLLPADEDRFDSVIIDASVGYRGFDPEDCVSDLAEGVEDFEGYSSLTEERGLDGPTPPRDGAGTVYSYTFTADNGDEFPLVVYIECRPIDADSMIRVSIYTSEESLEDNLGEFEDILDSIEVDGGNGGGTTDDETPESDDPDDDLGPDDEETPDPDDQEA